jgi:hypothetical protein
MSSFCHKRLMHRSNVRPCSAATKQTLLSVRDRTYLLSFGGIYFFVVALSGCRDRETAGPPAAMATGCCHAPVSIPCAFGRGRTSNVRQVRRTYVAHANRAGRTRLSEAYFRMSSLPKRGDRARQISIGRSSALQIWPHRQIKPTFAELFNSWNIEKHFCSFRLG